MIYVSSFKLSPFIDRNPNAYPDRVFKHMAGEVLLFERITVFYGNNGSGKSSLLNIIANKLGIKGNERMASYGENKYAERFMEYCSFELGEDEREHKLAGLPDKSLYLKSEDILYEIKKIQQQAVLREGLLFEQAKQGANRAELAQYEGSFELYKKLDIVSYAQEKYSNGETSMQLFEDHLLPGSFYLLDEPETSLSPANQIKLAEQMNELARYFDCQFIIATHSPFMLGTLHAKIYNLDAKPLRTAQWYELDNVRFFQQFFQKHQQLFE
ncbi:ATPase AAA [Paenibacillus montaniterrae]|uniref:ATPase AAA n=1 Tax=Paenibacillus montaniterrae TaxID=429341 RepID=A0A920CTH8_9BACL|nr:AAA family ATPase [Paenibacillus montaniterrae]GIP15907.1 ATPase AAA [Paenibacillus montaniterrae]